MSSNSSRRLWFTKRPIFHKKKSRKFKITLPVELWTIIIYDILDDAIIPDTHCQPTWPCVNTGKLMPCLGNEEYRSLSLVCHTWAQIIGPPTHFEHGQRNTQIERFRRIVRTPDIARRLTCLVLKDRGYGVDVIRLLFDNFSNLPAVRSLSLELYILSRNTFNWNSLSTRYPLLIYLFIFGARRPTKVITFEYLENLSISYDARMTHWASPAAGKFCLPSIKNLAFEHHNDCLELLLQDHGRQLHSLTLTEPYLPTNDFWGKVPNLLTLDVPVGCLHWVGRVPVGHPLQRLCVHNIPKNPLQLEEMCQLLIDFPQVSYLRIAGMPMLNSEFKSISRLAKQQGTVVSAPWRFEPRYKIWLGMQPLRKGANRL